MAAIIINNTAQFRITWAKDGTPFAINVIHGIKDDALQGVDQARAQGIADNIASALTAMTTNTKSSLKSTISLSSVGVRDMDQANNPEFLATPTSAFTFGGVSELLPLNVASCVTLRTDKAGASYRGRVYITGFAEGVSSDGVMSTQARTASTDIVKALQSGLDASGFTMSVASRKLGVSRPVTSIVSRDATWDTQRRRIVPGV